MNPHSAPPTVSMTTIVTPPFLLAPPPVAVHPPAIEIEIDMTTDLDRLHHVIVTAMTIDRAT
jgi:hypothetical protein